MSKNANNNSQHDVAVRMLRSRLLSERERSRREIAGEIENLRYKLDAALRDIKAGQRVDPHIVANSVMITESVARWNLMLELDPIADALELDE